MKYGLQYNINVTKSEIRNAGLSIAGAEYDELPFAGTAPVVRISCSKLEQAVLDGAIEDLSISGVKILVIETIGLENAEDAGKLSSLLIKCLPGFRSGKLEVCIENGYLVKNVRIKRGALSDGSALARFTDCLNEKAGEVFFKTAFNVGCARALKLQIPEHVKALGNTISVLYLSDNDGRCDLRQMPYTFTSVHGVNSAQWDVLSEYFSGYMREVFIIGDIRGVFEVSPPELKSTFLGLMAAILDEWKKNTENGQIMLPVGEG